jgi:tumor protein p53-inducible protein 3
MKAILYDAPGDPEVLRYGDTPDPVPGQNDLLVRVHAAGINRADLSQRRGNYDPPPGASTILGLELAGEVVKASGQWQVGDRVMAVVTGGGYAELCVVPADVAMRIPERFTYEEAAAIPEAFLTAYMNLFGLGKLNAFETVLIHAGASGVGSAAIQLAKAANARVFATAGSAAKLASCRDLGAEVVINYQKDSFGRVALEETGGQGVNLIMDFVGEPYWNENLAALTRGGRLVLVGFLGGTKGLLDIAPIMRKNLTVTGTTLRATPLEAKAAMTQSFVELVMPLFENGDLKPVIDSVYPIADAGEAHRYMESNGNIGKIILTV